MPTQGHCGTCRHWQFKSPDPADVAGLRKLDAYIHPLGVGRCTSITHPNVDGAADKLPKMAYVLDEERYAADFLTRASFGCTLHESAEVKKVPLPEPLKLRRLTIEERVALYAERCGVKAEIAMTSIRFQTNTPNVSAVSEEIDSPIHQFLDAHDIPRSEVQRDGL